MSTATSGRTVYRNQRADGSYRAYTTLVLLTLHRKGEISDGTGAASRELLVQAHLVTPPVTPPGMSNALHRLRSEGCILTDTDRTRTYSIRLAAPLSRQTVDALKQEEDWARAQILGLPLPKLNYPPPPIEFAENEEDVGFGTHEASAELVELDQGTDVPTNGFSVSVDAAILMRIIAEQALTIRQLRAKLGQSTGEDRPSGEVAAYLTAMLSGQ